MSRSFKLSCVAIAALLAAGSASAYVVTLSAPLAGGPTLGPGNYSGAFDGSGLLPGQFAINSASFSFVFADDVDVVTSTLVSSNTITGSYGLTSNGYDGSNYYYYYDRDSTTYKQVNRTGETESASVSLAGVGVGSGATALSTSNSVSSSSDGRSYDGMSGYYGYYYSYSCGNYTCGGYQPGSLQYYYTNAYTQTQDYDQDWTGGFTVSGDLTGNALLADLLTTRQLQFGLQVAGDLNLISGQLTLDVTEISANDVPEPGSLALVLGAVAGLGATSWRRRWR